MNLTKKNLVLADAVESRLGATVTRDELTPGDLAYVVAPADLLEVCRILHDDESFQFEVLLDVSGVDYLDYGHAEWDTRHATSGGFSRGVHRGDSFSRQQLAETQLKPAGRFAVVYQLLSVTQNRRVRLKTYCANDEQPLLDSVIGIWASADWYEREAFDLFGIVFVGHPDLRRILTDYGFIGHPFRKDFPLTGNVEMRYDPDKGRVVYEPVSIEPRTQVPKTIRDDNRYTEDLKDADNA
ncbi:MAG: NADH-quinone oxidoreductase subunit C [Gammaproteobacteria bacterium]|nr:NADH-quinone oxidoreductase subunit C [Gammaproteobacteria bacterium]